MLPFFPFQFGAFGPLCVRRECVALGLARRIVVLYASDLHFGWPWSNPLAGQLVNAAREVGPDVIVLGGDLADTRGGLGVLGKCVAGMSSISPVYAIPGNHDARLGIDRVSRAVNSSGGKWLADRSVVPTLPEGIARDILTPSPGTPGEGWGEGLGQYNAKSPHPNPLPAYREREPEPLRRDNASSSAIGEVELHAAILGDDKTNPLRVLCAHNPAIFPAAIRAGYRLVLAGHLHGGQCVLKTHNGRLYPGAFFARWTGLRFTEGDSTMLVSRGAADTLPFRWNCPREVIVCEIT